MIVVDSSAVVAILNGEDDAPRYISALKEDEAPVMSAATFVELCAVMTHKRGPAALDIVDRFIEASGIAIEPLTEPQAVLARAAYSEFSALNFGDVFSYALAKSKNLPLLYKGDDFRKTDIKAA